MGTGDRVVAVDGGAAKSDLVVAVDGGGAKTDFALLRRDGSVVAFIRGTGSQVHYLGIDRCAEVLEGLLETAIEQTGLGAVGRPFAATAQIFLAGADTAQERSALHAAIGGLHWSERLVVDNDTLAVLRAGTDRGWGIAVVCGAGMNCLGVAPGGREARFAALGPISGDWGGGSDVGMAALGAAVRSVDGRGPRTVLADVVPAHFGMSDPLELTRALHRRQISESRLAELAPVVLEVCAHDPVAAGIVGRLADEVVAFALAAMRRLELAGSDPEVILGGSILRALTPSVVDSIADAVGEVAPGARVVASSSAPIVGAALLALDDLRADATARAAARAGLDAAVSAMT
jgi:N-acetylglucosamine kinase-like BadF-type ATPase